MRLRRFLLILALLAGCGVRPCPAQEHNTPQQASQVGGRTSPDGKEELTIDLPGKEHLKNCAGTDGLGLCVFTSLAHAGRWQNNGVLAGFQALMKNEPGGGWPEKVDRMLKKHAADATYVQYSGNDPSVLKLALRTGRLPCVTYGFSPRYGGKIAHMVNLVHLSDRWACVLDNNFPGENAYEWMAPDEFYRRWKIGGGGWAIVLLDAPPPPIPTNSEPVSVRVIGQCRNGQCSPVRAVPWVAPPSFTQPFMQPTSQPAIPTYDWTPVPGREDWYALRCNSVQIGAWCKTTGQYLPLVSHARNEWGSPAACPITPPQSVEPAKATPSDCQCGGGCKCSPPCKCQPSGNTGQLLKPKESGKDFGVERGKSDVLQSEESIYALNGKEISEHHAFRVLQAGPEGLSDDTKKLRLTLIGSSSECQKVLHDLESHPSLASWKGQLVVQAYRPGDWAIQGVGFGKEGHPRIVLQTAPDSHWLGRVLHTQGDYGDGAEGLAGTLRNADPSYQPDKSPDLRKITPRVKPSEPKEPKEPDERREPHEPEKVANRSHYLVIGAFVLVILAICLSRKGK